MLTLLRSRRRPTGVALVVLTLMGAASASFHSHGEGTIEGQPGLWSHVLVSVIANPDSPGRAFHLHAGTTAPAEACPACVLCSAHGVLPAPVAAAHLTGSVRLAPARLAAPAALVTVRADSRSPPAQA